ncbi:MAG: PMT family glycosyltransferase, 4-amino-4-deoxy-L-arabinose transferase [Candidatus Gottesmanbacteria bacterium GW2011_GWA2_43_14]|uniref:PMT family glycosyltransferase, 4-amino-4-deoxy-L-arabinose transferase n=1 Tax=Candidatus Gottesmanbacteria bacterium GW2011_GWA2_43_14 TaxID=1618443 RepID=A0A0G1DJU2_9BACT|nr:MAG: PMT family glycosyltransferase, 4-amino-4-deoxy-L-arabinose transferase [Candidatus Gottesmanbacteria bacterium GW2011_GWA2_43_14]
MKLANSRRLLFFIFTLGLILRLAQRLPTLWDGDNSYYYLIARHIVQYADHPVKGPYAWAIKSQYPVIGYYILALPMLISSNLEFIISLIAATHALAVFPIYLIGKLLFNNRTGLLSALFFAVATNEIFYSRNILGGSLIIPLTVFSFAFFLIFLKKSKLGFFFLSYLFIFISSFIYYTPFLLLIPYAVWAYLKTKNYKLVFFSNLLLFLFFTLLNIPLIKTYIRDGVYPSFRPNFSIFKITGFVPLYLESIFRIEKLNILPAVIILLILLVGSILLNNLSLKKIAFLLFPIGIFLIAVSNNSEYCCSSYFTPVFPFYYLLIGYLGINIISAKKLSFRLSGFFLLFYFLSLISNSYDRLYRKQDDYLTKQKLAEQMIIEVRQNELQDFNTLMVLGNYIHSPSLWYFFEEKLEYQFSKFSGDSDFGINMINETPEYLFIVCDKEKIEKCHSKFLGKYGEYFMIKRMTDVGNFAVFLFKRLPT